MKFLVLLFLLASCATRMPTPYQKVGDFNQKEGKKNIYGYYVMEKFYKENPDIKAVVFSGNQFTLKSNAELYSEVAAIAHCRDKNLEAAIFLNKDFSEKEMKVGSYTTGGYTVGDTYVPSETNVYSYNVTYPRKIALFSCYKYFKTIGNYNFTKVDPALLGQYVKDFKGGILVKATGKNPKGSTLRDGDVILKAGKTRITEERELLKVVNNKPSKIKLKIVRKGKIRNIKHPVEDLTSGLKDRNDTFIKGFCSFEEKRQLEKAGVHAKASDISLPVFCANK